MSCEENPAIVPALHLPEAPPEQNGPVKAWSEPVDIATYFPEKPDRNPMFLESRVYQGSSGRVYPLPFFDRVAEQPVMHAWKAIHLENEFLRLMILPDIGGRIHVGLDKTNGYDFFYRQNVIKPALVGLSGPWVSGGVEFNWPQHHRPATFMPVEIEIERHSDGSVTVWCSDHDPLQRMKGMHGVCLHPGRAIVEVKVRLYNRTELTQTFLWWANVATHVHERYQSFFPPDVRFVADHAKRAVTSFPHSDRPYYGVDYPDRLRNGVPEADKPRRFAPDGSYLPDDLSWYSNIPVPTSYMVTSTREDFFGGYDHLAEAGVLHYADHHIAPGKKQWTWGNQEFGYAWDRSLSDDGAPYIELMAGVYTDNQPDFSYLQPGETKSFSQYWYPLQKIGPPHAASLDCALRASLQLGMVKIGLQSTLELRDVTIQLLFRGANVRAWTKELRPGLPLFLEAEVDADALETDIEVAIEHANKVLLRYAPGLIVEAYAPKVAAAPAAPAEILSSDELYLTGVHLAQYRHATRGPEGYWREALRRDEGDARVNTALGRWHLDRGELSDAERLLRKAIQRLTALNPNPADGEAFYLLGIVLRIQGDLQGSYDSAAKAAWNEAWKAPAHFVMAQLDALKGHWQGALRHTEAALVCNAENLNVRNLNVVVLRKLGRHQQAATILNATRALDPLDHWSQHLDAARVPSDNRALLDLVWDYLGCGEIKVALELLRSGDTEAVDGSVPLLLYTLAWTLRRVGRNIEAQQAQRAAIAAPSDYCFPYGIHMMQVLEDILTVDPGDTRAAYYLGNLLYDRQRHNEAIAMWERASQDGHASATAHRNLGIALFNARDDAQGALRAFDRALQTDPDDGRILYERDQLWKRVGISPDARLRELLHHKQIVETRDDLSTERVTLLNQLGRPAEALTLLLARKFQPWEGGEGLVLGQFTRSLLLLTRQAIGSGDPVQAVSLLERALQPPVSLGEGRHLLANKSDIEYWLGIAHAKAGNEREAQHWLARASRFAGDFQQMNVLPISDMTYWRGAALRELGNRKQAEEVFESIRAYAGQLEKEEPSIDYFATSLPAMLLFREDLGHRQRVLVSLLRAQAELGLFGAEAAKPLFQQVLSMDLNQATAADFLQ